MLFYHNVQYLLSFLRLIYRSFNALFFACYRSTDRHMVDGYLLYVNWRNNHNHLIVCAQAPSKRGVSATTQERLTNV